MTVTAMKLVRNYNTSNADQSGETTTPEGPSTTLGEYCRTTIKVCMILDKQSWSAAGNPETHKYSGMKCLVQDNLTVTLGFQPRVYTQIKY